MTITVTRAEFAARLTELLTLADGGADVFVVEPGQKRYQLKPTEERIGKREFGMFAGRIHFAEDFEEPIPSEALGISQ